MLARRLLLAALGGAALDVGYTMTADEVTFWQGQAALLDPLAYLLKNGTSQSHTVGAGETDFLVAAWRLQSANGGTSFFHRQADFRDALPLSAGTVLTTDASNAGSMALICKPSLVTASDPGGPGGGVNRYVSDPRGLFFDRYMAIGELTQYELGVSDDTNTPTVSGDFPSDFTYGLGIHASQHDASWLGMSHSSGTFSMPILNENSDANISRFAETCIFPFTRTQFPRLSFRGVSSPPDHGFGAFRYLKLPTVW